MPRRRFRYTPGGVCSQGLHLVRCPRYRLRDLSQRVSHRLDELLGQITAENGWQIVAGEVVPDHEYLLTRVSPLDAPASLLQASKGRTATVLRQEFPYLRHNAEVLRSPSNFASSVGYVSETTVRRYIEHQWAAVLAS